MQLLFLIMQLNLKFDFVEYKYFDSLKVYLLVNLTLTNYCKFDTSTRKFMKIICITL